MSYELIGILILGFSQIMLGIYLSRELREQLRRNLALETQFQRWNAEQFGNITQRLDQLLDMFRTNKL